MNVVAINGSPRKTWNTALLLESALEGVASQGARTELVHLYDLEFRGCISSKVVADRFDPEKKARRRAEVFPIDCRKAHDLGARLAGKDR